MCGFWYLDLDRVQGAFTIRNAGGRAEPALRDLITADGIAGITEIMVVHHTGEQPPSIPPFSLQKERHRGTISN